MCAPRRAAVGNGLGYAGTPTVVRAHSTLNARVPRHWWKSLRQTFLCITPFCLRFKYWNCSPKRTCVSTLNFCGCETHKIATALKFSLLDVSCDGICSTPPFVRANNTFIEGTKVSLNFNMTVCYQLPLVRYCIWSQCVSVFGSLR